MLLEGAHSLPLLRSLQPRAKWAVVQQCRPASACRSLLSLPRSDSSAYSNTFIRIAHSSLPRRARLPLCASTLIHTIPHALVAGRPYHPSPHSHGQIHARQQSPPRPWPLFAHCPLPILGHVSPLSFVAYRKPLLLPTKPARPPP